MDQLSSQTVVAPSPCQSGVADAKQIAALLRRANRRDLVAVIFIFAVSRALWLAFLYLGGWKFPDAFCQWDCGWYLGLVDGGYMRQPMPDYFQANWAFFPFYPLLVRGLATATGLSSLLAGVLISNAAILAGVFCGCRYLRRTRPHQGVLPFIVLSLAGPYAFYFSSVYTEAVFFMLACATFLFWAEDRPILAGVTGFFLSATRSVGVFMTIAFGVDLLRQYGAKAPLVALRRPDLLLAGVLAPAGLFAFMAYLYFHVGDALAFSHIEFAWHRLPGNPFQHLLGHIDSHDLLDLLKGRSSDFYFQCWGLLGFILIGWLAYRGHFMEAAFGFFCLIVPLSTGLNGLPRFIVGCPVFAFAVTDILSNIRTGWVAPVVLAVAIALNLILLAAWFSGAPFLA